MAWKRARKEIEISSLGAKTAFANQSQINETSQINENPLPDSFESILLLPCSSKVLPRCQNGPQGARMEAPRAPNGNREELKMPAAGGAALKIKIMGVMVS